MNPEWLITQFDQLIEAPDAISRLRRFLREMAVSGKLVDKKVRTSATASDTRPDGRQSIDGAFWPWVSVRDVAECRLGKMLDKAKNRGLNRRYLRNVNVRWFDFDLSDVKEMRFEDEELDEFALESGDVLVCEGGEPGRAAVWDGREKGMLFQKAIHRVRLSHEIEPHFFVLCLREAAESERLAQFFTGATFKHLTGAGLAKFTLPFPPRVEQQRIVAKVNELMMLCDELERSLTAVQAKRTQLLDAILREAADRAPGSQSPHSANLSASEDGSSARSRGQHTVLPADTAA